MRMAATKVAVQMLPYLPHDEQTPHGLETLSEWLIRYYTGGPQQPQPQAQPPMQTPPVPAPGAPIPQFTPAAEASPDGDPGREQGDPGPQFSREEFPA